MKRNWITNLANDENDKIQFYRLLNIHTSKDKATGDVEVLITFHKEFTKFWKSLT